MFKHTQVALAVALLATATFSGCEAAPAKPAPPPATTATTAVPMKKDGGVYVVPVSVNGQVTLDCIVDSGATDVNIPADIFAKLVRSGSVQKSDYLGTSEYTLADGSTERGRTFRIKSLKVGNVVVNNVVASVGGDGSSALLGQSFLERFASWSLDNNRAGAARQPPNDGQAVRSARHDLGRADPQRARDARQRFAGGRFDRYVGRRGAGKPIDRAPLQSITALAKLNAKPREVLESA